MLTKRSAGVFAVVAFLLMAGAPRRADASGFTENKRVVVSTTPASPSLISAAGNWQRSVLLNSTTYWCLFGDQQTVFSTSTTTGRARLINRDLVLDGPQQPYTGAIYGVCESTNAVIDVWRFK